MTTHIEDAFALIETGDYAAANAQFSALLREENRDPALVYNAHFGLALCLFHDYSQTLSENQLLEDALLHAESAAEVYEQRFDLQMLLGQCYATKYLQTGEPIFEQKARAAYDASKRYAALNSIPPNVRFDLDQRVAILLGELGGN